MLLHTNNVNQHLK